MAPRKKVIPEEFPFKSSGMEKAGSTEVTVTEPIICEPISEFEGFTLRQMTDLHDEAIIAEDQAKRALHVIRLRAANLATTSDDKAEKEVLAAKEKVDVAIKRLHAVEARLYGMPRDIYGSSYGRE